MARQQLAEALITAQRPNLIAGALGRRGEVLSSRPVNTTRCFRGGRKREFASRRESTAGPQGCLNGWAAASREFEHGLATKPHSWSPWAPRRCPELLPDTQYCADYLSSRGSAESLRRRLEMGTGSDLFRLLGRIWGFLLVLCHTRCPCACFEPLWSVRGCQGATFYHF